MWSLIFVNTKSVYGDLIWRNDNVANTSVYIKE